MNQNPHKKPITDYQDSDHLWIVSVHDEAEPLCDEDYETTDITRVPFYERLKDVFENPEFCKFQIIIDTTEITVKKF